MGCGGAGGAIVRRQSITSTNSANCADVNVNVLSTIGGHTNLSRSSSSAVATASSLCQARAKARSALRRLQFGRSSERPTQQIEQLKLRLEELEAGEAEEISKAAAEDRPLPLREAARPKRNKLPDHLPRQEIAHEPEHGGACPACGGKMDRLGEDITEVLDYIPGRFRVIRHVRPKYACRHCDAITQAPAPALPTPRGCAAPGMLAHVLVSKYTDHLPLYRQSEIYARGPRPRPLDTERLGRAGGLVAAANRRGNPQSRVCRREDPRRRHAGAGAGARSGPNPDRAIVGLCPRRPAVLRSRTAGGGLLLQSRPRRRTPGRPSRALQRFLASRRLQRVRGAVRTKGGWFGASCDGGDHRGRLLEPLPQKNIRRVGNDEVDRRQGGARSDRQILRDRRKGPLRSACRAARTSRLCHPLARCVLHLGPGHRAKTLRHDRNSPRPCATSSSAAPR